MSPGGRAVPFSRDNITVSLYEILKPGYYCRVFTCKNIGPGTSNRRREILMINSSKMSSIEDDHLCRVLCGIATILSSLSAVVS